ncbi:MAG: OOP family OmpA-OmpF porin [Hydrogenophaga sp.]|jgi:OOP family OmpA-OmpF porin
MTATFSLPRRARIGVALAFAVLLSACAPATRITLLPQSSGAPSAVVVSTGQGVQVLAQPYAVAEVNRSGSIGLNATTAEAVRERHPELLALQPPAPQRFVLQFEPGRSLLTPASQALLPEVITRALSRAGGEIVITGHTDRQGSLDANDRLSLERAQAVRALLIERGFPPERIDAVGRGEREPVVATEDEVVEPRNRRAEVLVR